MTPNPKLHDAAARFQEWTERLKLGDVYWDSEGCGADERHEPPQSQAAAELDRNTFEACKVCNYDSK